MQTVYKYQIESMGLTEIEVAGFQRVLSVMPNALENKIYIYCLVEPEYLDAVTTIEVQTVGTGHPYSGDGQPWQFLGTVVVDGWVFQPLLYWHIFYRIQKLVNKGKRSRVGLSSNGQDCFSSR